MKWSLTFAQSKYINSGLKSHLFWIIKVMIFAGCLWLISNKVLDSDLSVFEPTLSRNQLFIVLGVIMLMPINWGLEIYKWKLATPHENLNFSESLSAVLGGLAMNWVLPFTSGDIAARLSNVNSRRKTAWAIALVRSISIVLTLILGTYGLLFYWGLPKFWFWLAVMVFIVLGIFSMSRYFQDGRERILKLLGISVIRFLIFAFQFGVLISVFIPELSWNEIIAGVGWVFLFRSVLPSLFGNFGVREASALVFFQDLIPNPELILIPTIMIWLINTVLPSIIGAFFIFNLKVKIAQ